MIKILNVSKSYTGRSKILDQIHFELHKADFTYLLGGSGTGKSTILKILATEETVTEGQVYLFGYDIHRANSSTLRAIRQNIGYIPQSSRLIPDLSVQENVILSARIGRSGSRRAKRSHLTSRMDELFETLGVQSKRKNLAKTLSGGEIQRVAIACALVRDPEIIIADEPTGSQDREYTWSAIDLFLKANQRGVTVVLATHDREIVRRVRKRCLSLNNGKLHFEEPLCLF